jgi:hypothetical protein
MAQSKSEERSGEGGLPDLLPGKGAQSGERLRERREGRRAKRSGEHGSKAKGRASRLRAHHRKRRKRERLLLQY